MVLKNSIPITFISIWLFTIPQLMAQKEKISSTLQILNIHTLKKEIVYDTPSHIEAPNWAPDGKTLIYNSNGLLYKISKAGGEPELIPTGFAKRINNDHGISPDGQTIVFSDKIADGNSCIYTVPVSGGVPVRITSNTPSYCAA